jgi:hypothetical protein
MSTYQPPGEPPSYAQPQDPWAGTQGVAAAPTDPIPQAPPAFGQFAPGVAAPSVWTQETISHGGYEYVPQQRSRVGMYVLVILAVIVLGGGGGYGAYRWITSLTPPTSPPNGQSTGPGTSTQPGSSTPGQSPTVEAADLKVGDCIFNSTPDDPATAEVTQPTMIRAACNLPKSYKVIKVTSGEQIPEGPRGTFDGTVTAPAMCAGTGYEAFFAWDSSNDAKDYFFCLTTN